MDNHKNYSVVIVTHNSEKVIEKCISHLLSQTVLPSRIVIVDSASVRTDYLKKVHNDCRITLVLENENVGFCRANNIGFEKISDDNNEYILFLNPDAFLPDDCMQKSIDWMSQKENHRVGIATPILHGWDLKTNLPSGRIDSAGIVSSWYGKWLDNYQGYEIDLLPTFDFNRIRAVCGAFMLCRKSALEQTKSKLKQIFPESFYMYKEDIYLSLYVQRLGWSVALIPNVKAYHCRGWNSDRNKVPLFLRRHAAVNDVKIALEFCPKFLPWAISKYFYVNFIE